MQRFSLFHSNGSGFSLVLVYVLVDRCNARGQKVVLLNELCFSFDYRCFLFNESCFCVTVRLLRKASKSPGLHIKKI